MKVSLNHKIIKELCGSVSFKRGDSFYQANKVAIHEYRDDFVDAIVHGSEDFHVTVETNGSRGIQTSCSCSALLDFHKSCQHVAAVLLAIYERKRQGITGRKNNWQQLTDNELTEDFLAIFQKRVTPSSGHQLHFEKREVLDVQFTIKPLVLADSQHLIGIEVAINGKKISNIRSFLEDIKDGRTSEISPLFIYDPALHCFRKESDAVLHLLIRVSKDESTFLDAIANLSNEFINQQTLFLTPSSWNELCEIVLTESFLSLEYKGKHYASVKIIDGPPPIQFTLDESTSHDYQLNMNGFERMIVFHTYRSVLFEGNVYRLEQQDSERLFELKQMIVTPGMKYIPISKRQLNFFLKKVVPGLKRIGNVQLSEAIMLEMRRTPLVAKLYFDRVRNRLLAGVEFHYENVVIQPLENAETRTGPLLIRDVKKEAEILQLMEESGFSKTEGGYFMQNEELEYDFLVYSLPKLQKLAQVFATTAVRNRVIRNNANLKIRVKVQKERTNWLEFKFEMDGVSNRQIKDILQALEVKQKYYRLPNGSLLSLETKEMEEVRRFLQAEPIQDDQYEATLNRPILQSLPFLDLMNESEVFEPEQSFHQFLEQLLHPERLSVEVPKSLDTILRDYQKHGYRWMKLLAQYGFGGVLADDMGLGKTIQSISYIVSELANIRERKCPVLIVCPSSLSYNWLHEFMTFAPDLQTIIIDGTKTEREALLQRMNEVDVVITSYPLLRRDITTYEKASFHTIFFDEAQAFKNPFTQTARSVKKLQAEHRFGLTGTPVENSLEELWSIYHVIFPELFKGLEEYSHLTRKTIARRVRPFLLRRMKEDVLGELPGKQETLEITELLPDQKRLYAAYLAKLRHETLKHLDKETFRKNRIRILAGLTRLRQICCHPALFVEGYEGSSAKFEQLMQILEESRLSGRRVLIFSQFTKMLALIGKEITKREQAFFYLDGQTPAEERVGLCQRFNEGERDLFLISLKAGGTGLNLTGADTVILYDLWWNPAVEEQAADRAHRMGQQNEVHVIKLLSRGTIEEKMNELQEKKRNLIAEILDSENKAPTALTEEDIREILMI
ncbi:DEAD/DEAH box helicase [Caldibacillus lycopersici]|uniref:DEAD/DEAH box helicase n=1 Tax=Perspicuibacillus lycopersici TaxID=1325689 RepID=A0AAE3IV73_9BACI|nr:DEAD/DEAH box helicase [Perspicuibacillus lycopersici]MCU9612660.1 DEAD/DEAH box helicase [Perspicuibacillus lycopersici]